MAAKDRLIYNLEMKYKSCFILKISFCSVQWLDWLSIGLELAGSRLNIGGVTVLCP